MMKQSTINKMMAIAKKVSRSSDHHSFKIGACISKKSRVIATGCNLVTKTHPKIRKYHPHKTLHAEMVAAFRGVRKEGVAGGTVFVYREKKNGAPGMSRPCISCRQILSSVGINHAVYTTDNGIAEEFFE